MKMAIVYFLFMTISPASLALCLAQSRHLRNNMLNAPVSKYHTTAEKINAVFLKAYFVWILVKTYLSL